MAWAPQPAGLVQLGALLTELQKGVSQKEILARLDTYRAYPDFNNYLAHIFARSEDLPVEIRQTAGLLLKNNLSQQFPSTADELKQNIKEVLLFVLPHPTKALRHTAGTCISAVVAVCGIAAWPELCAAMLQALQAGSGHVLDGGLNALYKIVEDSPFQMEATMANGQSVSYVFVPPLLKLLQEQTGDMRRQAIACLNLMAREMPGGLQDNMDQYLHSLFALAHDSHFPVRREVCIGLVQLLTLQPDRLQPFLYQVIEYMLQCNEVEDESVALESCEFWVRFCDADLDPDLLRPYLPRLIPMLMKNMVFEEFDEDVQNAEAAEAPATREDKDSELRPFHHKQKEHGAQPSGEGEEDEDDDEEVESHWNLRKCSAAGLDRLSNVYGDELLPVLMPIVEQRLQDPNWRARESAILALGAVSEGCHTGLLPYLGSMTSLLLPKMADARPMVRIITCWALSRYSFWLLAGAQEAATAAAATATQAQQKGDTTTAMAALAATQGASPTAPIGPVIEGLLRCALDHNRFVQAAAVSGISNVVETAGQEDAVRIIEPYLKPLVDVLSTCIQRYGRRNLWLAYEALSVLAEAAGSRLGDPTLVAVFMPPLIARLAALPPNDRDLISLLECLTMIFASLGRQLDAYAPGLYSAAMNLLAAQHEARAAAAAGVPHSIEYDRDLVVSALDLCSGLAEGLGPSIDPLVASSPLPQAIVAACTDECPDLRQSGFALVGDLARYCISHVTPIAPRLITAALAALMPQQLVQENMKACNNACWSLGEMFLKLPPPLVAECAQSAAERVAGILAFPGRLPNSLYDNAAITLGRLSMVASTLVAPHLPHFFVPWCRALRNVRDDVEKEHAFLGLCSLLRLNPHPAIAPGGFEALLAAASSWRTIACEGLHNEIAQVLQGVKQAILSAGTWDAQAASVNPAVLQKCVTMFHL